MRGRGLSDTVLRLFLEPRNVGPLESADGEAWAGSVEEGRYMRMQVRLEREQVAEWLSGRGLGNGEAAGGGQAGGDPDRGDPVQPWAR